MNEGKEALKIARNVIRVGRVSSRNQTAGTVKVLFQDRDNVVTKDIPVLEAAAIPNVGDQVICLFLGNGIEDGFCLGRFYSKENPPPPDPGV